LKLKEFEKLLKDGVTTASTEHLKAFMNDANAPQDFGEECQKLDFWKSVENQEIQVTEE